MLCSPSVFIQPGFKLFSVSTNMCSAFHDSLLQYLSYFFFFFFPLIHFPLLSLLCHSENQALFGMAVLFGTFSALLKSAVGPLLQSGFIHSVTSRSKFSYKRIAGIQPERCFASLSAHPFAITRAECKIFPLAASPALAVLVLYCA